MLNFALVANLLSRHVDLPAVSEVRWHNPQCLWLIHYMDLHRKDIIGLVPSTLKPLSVKKCPWRQT